MSLQTTTPAINVAAIVTALQGAVTASDVVTLMGTVVTAGMSFVLVWFGGRKVVSSFRAALTKGKLKL